MPYNPGIQDQQGAILAAAGPSISRNILAGGAALAGGISGAGKALANGLDSYLTKKNEGEAADAAAMDLAKSHPEVMTPERLDAFYGANPAGKQKIIGQVTSDVLNSYRQQAQEMDAQVSLEGIASAERRQVNAIEADMTQAAQKRKDAFPVENPNLPGTMTVPLTGQQIKSGAAPGVQDGQEVYDSSGRAIGVYVNGKFVPDKFDTVYTATGQQQVINQRTGKPAGDTAAAAAPGGPSIPAAPAGGAKPIDQATAQQFLKQAGGDKNKARELARAAGYTF